jgi:hypothetical protein
MGAKSVLAERVERRLLVRRISAAIAGSVR